VNDSLQPGYLKDARPRAVHLNSSHRLCLAWNVRSLHPVYQRVPRPQYRVLEVLFPSRVKPKTSFKQHVLAADELSVRERLCVLVCSVPATREMLKEKRHEGTESLGRVALTPIFRVEHVTDFGSADSADETDYAWRRLGIE
jgi:hypothetical protein